MIDKINNSNELAVLLQDSEIIQQRFKKLVNYKQMTSHQQFEKCSHSSGHASHTKCGMFEQI